MSIGVVRKVQHGKHLLNRVAEKLRKGTRDRGAARGARRRTAGRTARRVVVTEAMVDLGERFYLEKWWARRLEGTKATVPEK